MIKVLLILAQDVEARAKSNDINQYNEQEVFDVDQDLQNHIDERRYRIDHTQEVSRFAVNCYDSKYFKMSFELNVLDPFVFEHVSVVPVKNRFVNEEVHEHVSQIDPTIEAEKVIRTHIFHYDTHLHELECHHDHVAHNVRFHKILPFFCSMEAFTLNQFLHAILVAVCKEVF